MPWVTFVQDFDFSPKQKGGLVTIAYKSGTRCIVTRECARLAKRAGAAKDAAKGDQK